MTRRSSQRTKALLAEVRRVLGDPQPTLLRITQKPFDYDPAHLFRLVMLPAGDEPEPVDLVDYCLDLQHKEVQADLFRYALPICLRAWRQTLLGETTAYEAFVEQFYPALVDGNVFERLLSSAEARGVSHFIERSILDEIDAQDALSFRPSERAHYRWTRALTTAGVVLPAIADLWRGWWALETEGEACAAIQYASCFVYDEHDNPVFDAYTRTEGGGPPCLWEYDGHLYSRRWRDENVSFLRGVLTLATLEPMVSRAVERLRSFPMGAKAAAVHEDFKKRIDVVESRCRELPDVLATKQDSSARFAWTR